MGTMAWGGGGSRLIVEVDSGGCWLRRDVGLDGKLA